LLVLFGYRRRPAVLVGWLWYLGTLVPVIGLVQVGLQSMADRYTYIPLIGIFLALAWSIPPAAREIRNPKSEIRNAEIDFGFRISDFGFPALAGAVLAACLVLTFRQTKFWQSDDLLWSRALAVAENPITHRTYAGVLYARADELYGEAAELSRKGLVAEAQRRAAEAEHRMADAERQCQIALQMNPALELARAQLGEYRAYRGDLAGAWTTLSEGVALDPHSAGLRNRLGRVLAYEGRIHDACQQFREACRLDPESAVQHYDLATTLTRLGDLQGAQREWEIGRRLQPDFAEPMRAYAQSFYDRSDGRRHCPAAAVFHAQEACWASPTPQVELYRTLAEAHASAGQPIAAYVAAQRAWALAEANGRAELVSILREQLNAYDRGAARALAAAVAAPAISSLPGASLTLAILRLDLAEHRFPD